MGDTMGDRKGLEPLMILTSRVSKKTIDARILLQSEDQSKVEGRM